jgi:hypothetical protein
MGVDGVGSERYFGVATGDTAWSLYSTFDSEAFEYALGDPSDEVDKFPGESPDLNIFLTSSSVVSP